MGVDAAGARELEPERLGMPGEEQAASVTLANTVTARLRHDRKICFALLLLLLLPMGPPEPCSRPAFLTG